MTKPYPKGWKYAKENGLKTYIAGKPCGRCGVFEKFTSNSECINKCNKHRNREYKAYCRKHDLENRGIYTTSGLGLAKPKLPPEEAWRNLSPDFTPDNLSTGWM